MWPEATEIYLFIYLKNANLAQLEMTSTTIHDFSSIRPSIFDILINNSKLW